MDRTIKAQWIGPTNFIHTTRMNFDNMSSGTEINWRR